jgi:ribonuclease VapC
LSDAVWDASALLAIVRREPGWLEVAELAAHGHISAVNYCEVLSRLGDEGLDSSSADAILSYLELVIEPFGHDQARAAADLRPRTRHLGLSLGDRACLALGVTRQLPIFTADRTWARLERAEVPVEIRVIR